MTQGEKYYLIYIIALLGKHGIDNHDIGYSISLHVSRNSCFTVKERDVGLCCSAFVTEFF